MKRIGIVGGLGPETGCSFLLSINRAIEQRLSCQADLVLENVSVSLDATKQIARGEYSVEHERALVDAVRRLNNAEVELIAIPCNTVHVFIELLRGSSRVPILSITEETAKRSVEKSVNNIGVLGTSTTIQQGLHEKDHQKQGVSVVVPMQKDQKVLDEIIPKIIYGSATRENKKQLIQIARSLQMRGAEAIILGCTDLHLLVSQEDLDCLVIDTKNVLEEAVVREILGTF